jgi:hypothetical protein
MFEYLVLAAAILVLAVIHGLVGYVLYKLLKSQLASLIKEFRGLADAIRERPTAAPQTQHFAGQETKKAKRVGELPPEVVAPNLTKPPRPAGGFGSRASKRDDGDS